MGRLILTSRKKTSKPGVGAGTARAYPGLFLLVVALSFVWMIAWPGMLGAAPVAQEPCPGNRLANPGFEEGGRKTEAEGTSLSSWVANGWFPWFVQGSPEQVAQGKLKEPEFMLEDAVARGPYRVRSGRFSQKFFNIWSTHDAGFYQRVAVPRGGVATFSIWVQIYSGEGDGWDADRQIYLSDLDHAGKYRVYVGIDPFGNVPAGPTAPLPASIVWSEPVVDFQTRQKDEQGRPIDTWVQLSVTARAETDAITVFTRGNPEFAVKHNDSFWDDACLIVVAPTPRPTNTPAPTSTATETPVPTETATALPSPTDTPVPTETATAVPPTATQPPTATPRPPTPTPAPTLTPTPTQTPVPALTSLTALLQGGGLGLVVLVLAVGVFALAVVIGRTRAAG